MQINMKWIPLGPLNERMTDFSKYRKNIGVYRANLNGNIVYIGKATEFRNGGFRKRLRDYTRRSISARNYPAGRLMYTHRDDIEIDIWIFPSAASSIPRINIIEQQLIDQVRPEWNFLGAQ